MGVEINSNYWASEPAFSMCPSFSYGHYEYNLFLTGRDNLKVWIAMLPITSTETV